MDKIDTSLLGTSCVVDDVEINGLSRERDRSFVAHKAALINKSKSLGETLDSASQLLEELRSWGTFKDTKLELLESSKTPSSTAVPLKLIFHLSPRKYTISTGVEATAVGPSVYSNINIFNFGRVGSSLSVSSSKGLYSTCPFSLRLSAPLFGRCFADLHFRYHNSESTKHFTKLQNVASLFVTQHVGRAVCVKAGVSLLDSHYETFPGQYLAPPLHSMLQPLAEAKLSTSIRSSQLDHALLPHSGHLSEVTMELPLSSARPTISARLLRVFRLADAVSISADANAGWIFGSGSNYGDRFHLGGPFQIRGFEAQSLGPKIGSVSIGTKSFANMTCSLGTCFKEEYKHIVSAGMFVAGSISSTSPVGRSPEVNSSAGLFLSSSLMSNCRVELNFSLPLAHADPTSVSRGIQLAFSLGA